MIVPGVADERWRAANGLSQLAPWCDRVYSWPLPGSGATAERLDRLTEVARLDLELGRLVEAHADAVAVLAELGGPEPGPGQQWAVWAAGPARGVRGNRRAGAWVLTGTKQRCSGAGVASHALVDASTASGQRLFAVDLQGPGVTLGASEWFGSGSTQTDMQTVTFARVPAIAVGRPGDYLARPGFWAGALGPAACWHGGATAIADRLLERARTDEDPRLLATLGEVHTALWSSRAVLRDAAAEVDRRPISDHYVIATAARRVVERDSLEVITRAAYAFAPDPLAHDLDYSNDVADLVVYVRQHHGDHDLAELGQRLAAEGPPMSTVRAR